MLKVQYAGPKTQISHHGITYIKSKEDKYIYLLPALEILKSIDNDYSLQHSHIQYFEEKTFNVPELYEVLISYENDLEAKIEENLKEFEIKIEHEIEQVKKIQFLSDIDKEIWIKNIKLMHDYRIQRKINKILYRHCIQDIIYVITQKRIKEIRTPFNKLFFHVLNSVRGTLFEDINGLNAYIKEEADHQNNLFVKLYIVN